VTEAKLLEDLRRAAEPPAPKDFRPGVVYSGRMPSEITTEALPAMETEAEWEAAVKAMGIHLPAGYGLVLERAELAGSTNPAAWHRDAEDKGAKDTAYTAEATVQRWRYRFKVVLKDPRADADIAVLMAEARKAKRGRPLKPNGGGTMIISLADFQTGKTDILGGTAELIERSEIALAAKLAAHARLRPARVILGDLGDSTEMFQSSPNAPRTNDLQETEQVRVWRRILWRWISAFASVTEDLQIVGVPSNHCRVRRGKDYIGTTLDDWGVEVIAQVSDMAAVNPEAYGHVKFMVPNEYEEHVLIETSGTVLGFVHGHQKGAPNQVADFLKANGRQGIGQADIVLLGHFHHLRVQAFGHGQVFIICPTNDAGSSWFAASGEKSRPGVLSVVVEDGGWRDLEVTWTG
jgi:hypothetical protein